MSVVLAVFVSFVVGALFIQHGELIRRMTTLACVRSLLTFVPSSTRVT